MGARGAPIARSQKRSLHGRARNHLQLPRTALSPKGTVGITPPNEKDSWMSKCSSAIVIERNRTREKKSGRIGCRLKALQFH